MQIMLGYTEETSQGKWIKCEVTLDEHDLARLRLEDPNDSVAAPLTADEAWVKLEAKCASLLLGEVRKLRGNKS